MVRPEGFMLRRYFVLLATLLLGTACTTHMVSLQYEGSRPTHVANVAGSIRVGSFRDDRGTDIDWLGAIRGGFGNRLKTLRTEKPTREVVEDAFRQALLARGWLAEPDAAEFELNGSIKKLDCSYYSFTRESHAHLDVELVDVASDRQIFANSYRADQTEGGLGAGIFASVETLRQLAERTLHDAINQVLDDAAFARALTRSAVD